MSTVPAEGNRSEKTTCVIAGGPAGNARPHDRPWRARSGPSIRASSRSPFRGSARKSPRLVRIATRVRPMCMVAGSAIAIGPLPEHVPEFARR